MDQPETPTVSSKPPVDNVVQSKTYLEERIAAQIACATQNMVAKAISGLIVECLDGIQAWAYENASTGVSLVFYSVIQQVLQDLLRRDVIGNALDRHISTFFNSSDATDKFCRKLLSSNAFMAQMNGLIPSSAPKTPHLSLHHRLACGLGSKPVSFGPWLELEGQYSSLKASHFFSPSSSTWRKCQKRSSTPSKSAKLYESSSDSKSNPDSSHNRDPKIRSSQDYRPKMLRLVGNGFATHCTTTPTASPMNHLSTMNMSQKACKMGKWTSFINEDEQFQSITYDLDNMLSIHVETQIGHNWHLLRRGHVAFPLLHKEASSFRLSLSHSVSVKIE